MILKKAKYKKVQVWQTKEVSPEIHGCDNCKKVINPPNSDLNRLEMKAFWKGDEVVYYHFCSWKCVLEHLSKIKSNYFVDFPFVHFDGEGNTIKDLLNALKEYSIKRK